MCHVLCQLLPKLLQRRDLATVSSAASTTTRLSSYFVLQNKLFLGGARGLSVCSLHVPPCWSALRGCLQLLCTWVLIGPRCRPEWLFVFLGGPETNWRLVQGVTTPWPDDSCHELQQPPRDPPSAGESGRRRQKETKISCSDIICVGAEYFHCSCAEAALALFCHFASMVVKHKGL